MIPPDKKQVQAAIEDFLKAQYDKKAEPILKKLDKAEEGSEDETELREQLEGYRQKYLKDNWISDAATRMASQLNFGTHISKGVHSSSKGSSVIFNQVRRLPTGVLGSQSVKSGSLDATGNAAALPLAGFFNQPLEGSQLKIRDVITDYPELIGDQLSSDPEASQRYLHVFKAKLSGQLDQPINDELNKQMLWPADPHQTSDYICITPLYPSVLAHEVYQRITELRYSDANKQARDDRFKKTATHSSYVSLVDLGFVRLGGTKSQTVGQLNNQQGGRNLLLSSIPPNFSSRGFSVSSGASSVFGKNFVYLCREPLERLYEVIESNRHTMDERDSRKDAAFDLIEEILVYLDAFKKAQPAGWSKDYSLHLSEKLWLDPDRGKLEGEEDFAQDRAKEAWLQDLPTRFGMWLQGHLKQKFTSQSDGFTKPELSEWQTHFEQAIKRHQRLKTGVFS